MGTTATVKQSVVCEDCTEPATVWADCGVMGRFALCHGCAVTVRKLERVERVAPADAYRFFAIDGATFTDRPAEIAAPAKL